MNENECKIEEAKAPISEIYEDRVEKDAYISGEKDFPHCALIFFLIKVFGKGIEPILLKYGIRVAKRYSKDGKYGVAFIQRSKDNKIRQVKIMAYNPKTGKRLKDGDEVLSWNYKSRQYERMIDGEKIQQLGKLYMRDFDFINKQCFFGEHLLNEEPDKPVALVESEKTALICAFSMPEYVWLATGGKNGCKWYDPNVYSVLQGKEITLFPDLHATEDWKIKAEQMCSNGMNISVYDMEAADFVTAEDRENGLDIADFILRVKFKENPELQNIQMESTVLKKANAPSVDNLLSKLAVAPQTVITSNPSIDDFVFDIQESDEVYQSKKEKKEAKRKEEEERKKEEEKQNDFQSLDFTIETDL
jgi:ribosomal protein L12E/L44/L45/RPP1/RPP2